MHTSHPLFEFVKSMQATIRDNIIDSYATLDLQKMSEIAAQNAEDTIYEIDRISDEALVKFCEDHATDDTSFILIAEGISDGELVFPKHTPIEQAKYRMIIDPIDGTRGIMYQKRSAWILTGVAPNLGIETKITDIDFAMQTEIPIQKQYLCDVLWAERGKGMICERYDHLQKTTSPIALQPSQKTTIAHGFATISRFFPGMREILAKIDDALAMELFGQPQYGQAQYFEDQYICTGGQLYEIIAGHDRFCADLRPLTEKMLNQKGLELGLCCHPYDICTALIAQEAGVILEGENQSPLDIPLDLNTPVTWFAYANEAIYDQISKPLQKLISFNLN